MQNKLITIVSLPYMYCFLFVIQYIYVHIVTVQNNHQTQYAKQTTEKSKYYKYYKRAVFFSF